MNELNLYGEFIYLFIFCGDKEVGCSEFINVPVKCLLYEQSSPLMLMRHFDDGAIIYVIPSHIRRA